MLLEGADRYKTKRRDKTMTMYCDNCGAQAKPNAKFCGQCGNRIAAPGTSSPSVAPPIASQNTTTVRPSAPVAQSAPPNFSGPPPMENVPSSPPPPQYWESYDYPSVDPSRPRDWIEKSERGPQAPPPPHNPVPTFRASDASRPLPPLWRGWP